jgi:hypothetical protein
MATKKMTQIQAVLNYLQTHKGLTSMQAFEKFGATRLSAIIFVLRRRGFTIINVDRTGTNRFGEPVKFVEYRLLKNN